LRLSPKLKVSLVVVGSVAIGVLLGSTVLANLFNQNASGIRTENQGLLLSGMETIKVLAPNGNVVSQWSGPDPLTNAGMNALAACIPGSDGGSTSPIGPGSITGASGSCSSFINGVAIVFGPADTTQQGGTCADNAGGENEYAFSETGCQAEIGATNTLTPLGCDPNSSTGSVIPPLCTGWITEATFGPTTFTPTNCIYTISQTPCGVLEVDAGTLTQLTTYGHTEGFDYLNLNATPILVASGDSLLVTIQFTVS
jgi:hypothetical protein